MVEGKFTVEQIRGAANVIGLETGAIDLMVSVLTGPHQNHQRQVLTIICNEGIHAIPKDSLPGRVFTATTGNLPDASAEELTATVAEACAQIARLLKHEGPFTNIYLVPSGYGVILQKLAETVFQIIGKPAVTLHYDRKSGAYWPIDLDIRTIVGKA